MLIRNLFPAFPVPHPPGGRTRGVQFHCETKEDCPGGRYTPKDELKYFPLVFRIDAFFFLQMMEDQTSDVLLTSMRLFPSRVFFSVPLLSSRLPSDST